MSAAPRSGPDALSGFERRCLLRHIHECRELLQLTVLGACQACSKCQGQASIAEIRGALEEAERALSRAEGEAERELGPRHKMQ